jgi:hypothetical protein
MNQQFQLVLALAFDLGPNSVHLLPFQVFEANLF